MREMLRQGTKQLPADREEPSLMISSRIRSRRGPAYRLSVRTSRNGRLARRVLTIIILCLVLIPLVQQNRILAPPGRPAGQTVGDELGPGMMTSPIFAVAVQLPPQASPSARLARPP